MPDLMISSNAPRPEMNVSWSMTALSTSSNRLSA